VRMIAGQPVAYIRRSARSRSDPGDLSREFQTEKVRELAGADGPALRIIDADWGRSASTDKTDKRLAFLALMESIERGEVSTLYAYASDRLARSVQWSARLLDACEAAGTTIVTGEGRFAPGDDMARKMFQFQAISNEDYSRQAQHKRRATVERQREHGDKLGPKFYGELPGESAEAVLAAFEAAGSAHGAAVRLNEIGVKPRRGGTWGTSVVRSLLVRCGRIPALGTRGAKPRAPFPFYRLLRCHCGRTLTGVVHRYGKDLARSRVIYRCVNASSDPRHGRATIAEHEILPWAVAEAARLAIPADALEIDQANAAERERQEARRARIVDAYVDGTLDKAERDRRLGEVDAIIAKLARTGRVAVIPSIDWDASPESLNAVLRALWERIDLGGDLRPVAAVWRVPEWRAA
jgi:DNA invertase Pin-like site-specific DNA recombinase